MRAFRAYFRSPAAVIGSLIVLAVVLMALTASIFFPGDPLGLAGRPLQWPGADPRFPLGTDPSGRDIAAQIFHGARISLLIGFVATSIAVVIGITIGALAGFYGSAADTVLMRVTEAFQTLPIATVTVWRVLPKTATSTSSSRKFGKVWNASVTRIRTVSAAPP